MTLLEASTIIGGQPQWAVRNMRVALSLHSWSNTAQENERLQACKVVLRNWTAHAKHQNELRDQRHARVA